ncbi:response regulator [Trinickia dinghuensis]|uniref:DNA-binding response regulator n=1 Tax=Trinickia dinghuensis TaxID=2291023 RepID=A0A3D8JZ06_9BURK|nr:response regulator transcription factor [Trinickia dinghuensis]RDU97601.1 DNA-binding response regulator [Trinickia dinghuensis]
MIRILLADDHSVFREGLREVLEGMPGIRIEGEASDAASTLALVRRARADLLLLDLSMPGRSGIELIRKIREEAPQLKVLVLTMHEERHYALRAFMAGAHGYLTKHAAAPELSGALRKVSAGGTYVGPWMADYVARNLIAPPEAAPHQQLSDREFDIFMRLARGNTAAEIGLALSLSTKTVSNYKARVCQTMRFSNDAALVRYAVRHQLIDDHDIV